MSETYETDRAAYESRLKHKGFQRGYRAAVNALRDTIAGDMNQDRDPNGIAPWLLERMEAVAAEVEAE